MGPQVVVEPEVVSQCCPGLPRVWVSLQVHLFVLHRAQQPLQEDVVGLASLSVHADPHPAPLKDLGELLAGELGFPGRC